MKTVVVALSGGVDSAVSAYLLKKRGYRVIALFMKNWEENDCNDDYEDVVLIAERLAIPFYSVNFAKEYKERVFNKCLSQFERGVTPNPDIGCNSEIKFKSLLKKAEQLGADYLATGHYCRTENNKLLRGKDENKDQSYFLYAIDKNVLSKVIFPVGDLVKTEVRKIAKEQNLHVYKKKDSCGICFIGERKFDEFLSRYIEKNEGDIVTTAGKVVAQHDGLFRYTIGQRKGICLSGGPWYVIAKNLKKNQLVIAHANDDTDLLKRSLRVKVINWLANPIFKDNKLSCSAKIRYRQKDQKCIIVKKPEGFEVIFDEKQRAITAGQSVVFYDGDFCLGGGIIENDLY